MKLTKAQQEVLDRAIAEINEAKSYNTVEEYVRFIISDRIDEYENETSEIRKDFLKSRIDWWTEILTPSYYRLINNIALTHCNSKTLYKLEEYGLIEILEDGRRGVDTIKVLNI